MITQYGQMIHEEIASTISWVGDVYQIGSEEYDFSQLIDGEILPASATGCELLINNITRIDGELSFEYIRQYVYDEDNILYNEFPPTLDNTQDSL